MRLPAAMDRGAPNSENCRASRLFCAKMKVAKELRCHAPPLFPAASAAFRHARVDKRHGDAALGRREHQVRPDFAFGENCEIGLPVAKEPLGCLRCVDGSVLV